jgi:hypothetical protein
MNILLFGGDKLNPCDACGLKIGLLMRDGLMVGMALTRS